MWTNSCCEGWLQRCESGHYEIRQCEIFLRKEASIYIISLYAVASDKIYVVLLMFKGISQLSLSGFSRESFLPDPRQPVDDARAAGLTTQTAGAGALIYMFCHALLRVSRFGRNRSVSRRVTLGFTEEYIRTVQQAYPPPKRKSQLHETNIRTKYF